MSEYLTKARSIVKDWNLDPDFHVIFLPRSGSHMLVNALNHHPEIDCSHSDQGHSGYGDLKGHAQCTVEGVKKALILTRNADDRVKSFFTSLAKDTGDNHSTVPVEVERMDYHKAKGRFKSQRIKGDKFLERVKGIPERLEIPYEEITGDRDIREIPEEWSYRICDFLGVKRMVLKTDLHKPVVHES
ncbi:MAG: hypothetical protein KJO69_04005 [Gammaproteobacteria bacterium]|nr:hypothetical protein [Gammaproteobacteria bacterium]